MPSLVTEAPLSAHSTSASSSFDGPPRKSHEKTLGGVFAYTNGTNVETGLPDHRLDQLKSLKNSSLHSLPNGTPNGGVIGTRERSHSKAGSTNSMGSGTLRYYDPGSRGQSSSDGLTKLSTVEHASGAQANSNIYQAPRKPDLGKLRTGSHQSSQTDHEPQAPLTTSTAFDSIYSSRGDEQTLSPHAGHLPPLNRFSSPSGMSPGAAIQDSRPRSSVEPSRLTTDVPRLVHRHTLQVPKISTSRTSRDFSFAVGPSEEVLTATGRFSPTHSDTPRHRRASLGLIRRTTRSMQSEPQLDGVVPDEDAARWTEAIRQKRASRRKRKEEEDDDRVIVGKKVEEGHVNWVTAYNMLTGIRFTVSRTNAKMDRELTDVDFSARHKFSFDITGNELTPSAKYDFKFKDYSPWVFRHLRAIFGLDPADYLMSLTSKYILSELGSPGKSGSFFYFSRDYKYIIKTIHHAEHKLLRKILRDYYRHVVDNPNTLISQFYGLHRVKIPYGRKIHFVVMNNLFPPHRDIHQTFDLKGSTVGRDFKEENLVSNPRATLKDLNWLRRDLHLEFDPKIKQIFVEQIQRDVALLQRLHIMDYSMLVGLHDVGRGNDENLRETTLQVFQPGGERTLDDDTQNMLMRTPSRLENVRKARQLRLTLKKEKPVPMGLVSAKMPDEMEAGDERRDRIFYGDDGGIRGTHEDGRPGEEIYYLGIIDCLTHYGVVKRLEHFWKGLQNSRTQISPIPPEAYGERFINFIDGVTMTKEEAQRRLTSNMPAHPQHQNPQLQHISTDSSHPPAIPALDGTSTVRSNHAADTSTLPTSPTLPSAGAVEMVMRKAQKQVDKSTNSEKGRRRSEEEIPDRTLGTTDRNQTTLPVVEEVGENGNINGSFGRSNGGIRQVSGSTAGDGAKEKEHLDVDVVEDGSKSNEEKEKTQKTGFESPQSMSPEKSVVDVNVPGRISPAPNLGPRVRRTT